MVRKLYPQWRIEPSRNGGFLHCQYAPALHITIEVKVEQDVSVRAAITDAVRRAEELAEGMMGQAIKTR